MIQIIDVRSYRPIADASPQTCLNDLKALWNWAKVVDSEDNVVSGEDLENDFNVKQLWLNDKLYFEMGIATGSSSCFYIKSAVSSAYSLTCSMSTAAAYTLIKTDKTLAVRWNKGGAAGLIIGETVDNVTGESSYGIAFTSVSSGVLALTDTIVNLALTIATGNYAASTYVTQVVPFAHVYSRDIFKDVYRVVIRKASDDGETKLNGGDHYYIMENLAIKYTP